MSESVRVSLERLLAENPERSAADLATELGVTRQRVSFLLKQLEYYLEERPIWRRRLVVSSNSDTQ